MNCWLPTLEPSLLTYHQLTSLFFSRGLRDTPHPRHTTLGVGGFQTFPCSPRCSDVLANPDNPVCRYLGDGPGEEVTVNDIYPLMKLVMNSVLMHVA